MILSCSLKTLFDTEISIFLFSYLNWIVGFSGNGKSCVDIDECAAGSDWCNENISQCFNEIGDFSCYCNSGYQAEIKNFKIYHYEESEN